MVTFLRLLWLLAPFLPCFEPMELEGKLLIDGGVLNNYPIEELKSLGANFIVGVDVQQDLSKEGLWDLLRIFCYRLTISGR